MQDPELLAVYASWADELKSRYKRVSRLFKHGPSIGRAREVYLADILSRALPAPLAACHGAFYEVGRGASAEQDILVVDRSRHAPIEEVGDFGIYHRDAVLACIEVKSKLTRKELHKGIDTLVQARRLGPGGATQYILFAYETTMSPKELLSAIPDNVEFFDYRPNLMVVLGRYVIAMTEIQPRSPRPQFTFTVFRPKKKPHLDLTLLEFIDTVLGSKTGSKVDKLTDEIKSHFEALESRKFICPEDRPGKGLGTNYPEMFRR